MKVYKFGGTSVGLPERMKKVATIITGDDESKIVVLSAISGTTNDLVAIDNALSTGSTDKAQSVLNSLRTAYTEFIAELLNTTEAISSATVYTNRAFDLIQKQIDLDRARSGEILAQGELLSTNLFQAYMEENGQSSKLINALDFVRTDEQGEPDIDFISRALKPMLSDSEGIYITQGFICRDCNGEIHNLQRGGSDYSASLIGASIGADEIQIWTDIDGMHNNDPRIVDNTYPIAELSFDEAAELAYFGAKILHPSSILPAKKYNIPVRLKSTMNEKAGGTLISKDSVDGTVKAIAVKDGITAIKIKSTRMLLAYGFLRNIFTVFEKHKTPIDMITTSEVAVSLTIDDPTYLEAIIDDLNAFGTVEVDQDQSIVCVVGNMVSEKKGVVRKIFNALSDIPIRMVSYGGSRYNISMLIDTSYKHEALNNLNSGLFE